MSAIYIPLCFYFILRKAHHNFNLRNLHSTMLLLYPVWESVGRRKASFTFHYASTLSSIAAIARFLHSSFTFHYASTLSDRRIWKRQKSTGIYIPLCFYFIGKTVQKAQRYCIFTFHYASTLSLDGLRNSLLNVNLHSTMLLLYPAGDCSYTS